MSRLTLKATFYTRTVAIWKEENRISNIVCNLPVALVTNSYTDLKIAYLIHSIGNSVAMP
jgi:hypothetical protein